MKRLFVFLMAFVSIALFALPVFAEGAPPQVVSVLSSEKIDAAQATLAGLPAAQKENVLTGVILQLIFISVVTYLFMTVLFLATSGIVKLIMTKGKAKSTSKFTGPPGSAILGKIRWYALQLFPLTYRSHYVTRTKKHFAVWRMWFGKCFDCEDVIEA